MEPFVTTIITALISSSVGALVAALVSRLKMATKEAAEDREIQRLTLLLTCRMSIYDEHIGIDEKLDVYKIYRDKCHGNHQTKQYMDKLVGCDVDEYIEKHTKD